MFMKCKSGSMMKLLPVLLGVVVVVIMTSMYLSFMADYDNREYADYLAREYILRMESKGYMSRQDGYELINKLQERGFYNVNFSGSTTTPPGYGKEITLSINAKVKIKKYMINKLLDVTDLTESSQIRIVKKSTAKY